MTSTLLEKWAIAELPFCITTNSALPYLDLGYRET